MNKQEKEQIAELIKRRRLQLLIHSCIYYEYNTNLVSDSQWATWAIELEELQVKYPKIAEQVIWAEAFKDFDHSTGYNLPTRGPWVMGRAKWMMECAEKFKDKY